MNWQFALILAGIGFIALCAAICIVTERCRSQRNYLMPPVPDPRDWLGEFMRDMARVRRS